MAAKIVVHGGAGFWRRDIRSATLGVGKAAWVGAEKLVDGGSALDAVESAVSEMEDHPIFNAGKGSALTWVGTAEMDAAIMDGRTLAAGAVTLVRRTRNPVRLARIVMENTDHVLIAGKTAERLAKAFRLPSTNPITAKRRQALRDFKKNPLKARLAWAQKTSGLLLKHPEILGHDTVGAVAVDEENNFAAAASTGGLTAKLPGRIGDTPLIGSGLYSDEYGAATATGWGEVAVKLVLSKTVCLRMDQGMSAPRAAEACVRMASNRLNGHAGIIAIDRKGRMAVVHNTTYMPWAYWVPSMKQPRAKARGRIVARL
jgi:beta-aspartyl-peptidase (threonine type)